jgi:integrase
LLNDVTRVLDCAVQVIDPGKGVIEVDEPLVAVNQHEVIKGLHQAGDEFLVQSITELFSEDIIRPFADWLLKTRKVSSLTVADRLRQILPLARYHPFLKGKDFAWLTELISELPPPDREKTKRRKEQKFVHFAVMATVPGQLLKKAEKTKHLRKKAILVRNALLIGFLLVLAWRQRNIRECVLAPSWEGGNIFKEQLPALSAMELPASVKATLKANPSATFWQFSFDSDGTKSKRHVRASLPCQLVPLLERYIELRPALLKPGASDSRRLFLNDHGDPLTPTMLARIVARITSRYVGKRVNPHLFRDIHAVGWLSKGRKIDDLSNNLWHTDPGFTREFYAGLYDESFGTQGVEEWLGADYFETAG